MQLSIVHIVFMAVGLLIGGLVVWFILKGRLNLADAEGRAMIERTSLTEQFKASLRKSQV